MILNQTGGTQFSAHCLRGAVIGRLEERWVQQGKPKLARRSFYLNQEKKSVLGTKPWSFWAEVLLKSPDHVQAPSCWLNQLTMALNWTYRAFCRELASARGAASESSLILDVFPSWVPLRAIHRAITEIIYRAIYTILDDHKMDKWTKSRVIYHKNHKNREYRGFTRSQCKCRAQ